MGASTLPNCPSCYRLRGDAVNNLDTNEIAGILLQLHLQHATPWLEPFRKYNAAMLQTFAQLHCPFARRPAPGRAFDIFDCPAMYNSVVCVGAIG
jgi:hypothetical protein